MPANLPPQYLDAEKKFREARTQEEKIEVLEEMIAILPKHKGTDKIRAQLRRRMARLQDDFQRQKGTRKGHDPYSVKKEGAGQVALFGLPNSGKSSLVSSLTKARCQVAEYPYTTRTPSPGMMVYESIQIQLIDLPPLMDEASRPWLPRVLGKADSLALVLDAGEDPVTQMEILMDGLGEMGLGLDQGGGEEGGGQGEDAGDEGKPLKMVKGFICLNKADLAEGEEGSLLEELSSWTVPKAVVTTATGSGLDSFRRAAFESLNIIRVFTKAPRKKAEMTDPVILPVGATVELAGRSLHKDFARELKFARVWGEGVFEGQMVKRDHVLHDLDIVEFHL
jgi:ribosome-interacting GTPase 1